MKKQKSEGGTRGNVQEATTATLGANLKQQVGAKMSILSLVCTLGLSFDPRKGVRRTNRAVEFGASNALRRIRADSCVRERTRLARLRHRNAGNWPNPRFAAC